jgi:hypothetical protein
MKSIFKTTGQVFIGMTALFIYVSVARLIYAVFSEASSLSEYIALAIVVSFITLLVYASASLLIHEFKIKK